MLKWMKIVDDRRPNALKENRLRLMEDTKEKQSREKRAQIHKLIEETKVNASAEGGALEVDGAMKEPDAGARPSFCVP